MQTTPNRITCNEQSICNMVRLHVARHEYGGNPFARHETFLDELSLIMHDLATVSMR